MPGLPSEWFALIQTKREIFIKAELFLPSPALYSRREEKVDLGGSEVEIEIEKLGA